MQICATVVWCSDVVAKDVKGMRRSFENLPCSLFEASERKVREQDRRTCKHPCNSTDVDTVFLSAAFQTAHHPFCFDV